MEPGQLKLELEKIQSKQGKITAEQIVAAASRANHPLHDEFEWDNGVAGHQYRLMQARAMLRKVTFVKVSHGMTTKSVAYIRDPTLPAYQQGYISVQRLNEDRQAARTAILAEFVRIRGALTRARDLAASLNCEDLIDSLLSNVSQTSQSILEIVPDDVSQAEA